jgi:[ribosomal protein S5]-alanine N-acetyltransferase
MEFILRPLTEADAASFAMHANNANIARYMSDAFPHPFTIEHAQRFIANAMSHRPNRIFAIEVNGEAAGGIGIHPQAGIYTMNAELGYWLAEPHWGKGIISAAIQKMVTYGFETFPINRIYARPYGNNPASQKVLVKAGFTLEAKLNQTIFKNDEVLDELIYAVRRK